VGALHRFLWKILGLSAIEAVTNLIHSINKEMLQLPIKSVTLRMMRSRWGSCSMKGSITLSTVLLFADPQILRYVIIHELCHLRHPNHSLDFWNEVERAMPEYREVKRELRRVRIIEL
jgi:predicted metal-dependent hydrolase